MAALSFALLPLAQEAAESLDDRVDARLQLGWKKQLQR
jgi:hypothetical protein